MTTTKKTTVKKTNVAAELKADLKAGKKAAALTVVAQKATPASETKKKATPTEFVAAALDVLKGATTPKAAAAALVAAAPITVPASMGATEKYPFAILCILKSDNSIGYERFTTAKKRDARLKVLEADKTLAAARPENWIAPAKPLSKRDAASLAKKAAIEAKAAARAAGIETPKAEKPAKAPKTPKAPKTADTELSIRLYGAGKVFLFGKLASERIDGMPNMKVTIEGKKLTMTATKATTDTTPITEHQGRPILRAGKILKDLEWSGESQTLIARPVNGHGFEITLDAKGGK